MLAVRRLTVNKSEEQLPCEFCFGIFKARKLSEHSKKCFMKEIERERERGRERAESRERAEREGERDRDREREGCRKHQNSKCC